MRTVLIDDDPVLLGTVKDALLDLGLAVAAFGTPAEAVDWIRREGADLVLSDIVMPRMNGFEVLRKVKEIDPLCEVILITGHAEMETALQALRAGAADLLVKPFDPVQLRAAIERTARYRALARQQDLLSARVAGLTRELDSRTSRGAVIVGDSPAIRNVKRMIEDVAPTEATVLISGETGTGKELVAAAIHRASPRRDKPLLSLNCAAIPDALFESEMFGYIRGAFTGAVADRIGYAAAAEGGVLFLDEIGDLALHLQAKILRLLDQKTFLPVGGVSEQHVNVRVLAATNRSLETLVAEQRFRQDLYYRLSVCVIDVPPLRERREDIPLLALHLGSICSRELARPFHGIDEEAMGILAGYDYPGNVRELRNIIENAILRCRPEGRLTADCFPERIRSHHAAAGSAPPHWPLETLRFDDLERRLYTEALRQSGGNVCAAAQAIGISRGKLRRRMADLGLPSPRARGARAPSGFVREMSKEP